MRLRSLLAPSLALAVLLTALPATAQTQTKDIRMTGVGTRKCSEWVDWKTANNGEARATTIEWIQGFMSAHNLYARANSVVADNKILLPLLDAYCEKNATQRIFNAAIEITQSLGGAKVNITPKPPTPENPRPDSKGPRES